MDLEIFLFEAVLLVGLFTAMIIIPLINNPVWWIHDYPMDIQEKYFETHERVPSAFFSKIVIIKKSCALLFALCLLVGLIWLAGAESFWYALAVSYGLWLIIDWYDCFFLDWVLFANIKAVRLPGTEDMDKAYHQKTYHFVRSCWGMIIGLVPCLLGSALYECLFLN